MKIVGQIFDLIFDQNLLSGGRIFEIEIGENTEMNNFLFAEIFTGTVKGGT